MKYSNEAIELAFTVLRQSINGDASKEIVELREKLADAEEKRDIFRDMQVGNTARFCLLDTQHKELQGERDELREKMAKAETEIENWRTANQSINDASEGYRREIGNLRDELARLKSSGQWAVTRNRMTEKTAREFAECCNRNNVYGSNGYEAVPIANDNKEE